MSFSRVQKRDRYLVFGALVMLALLAWVYTARLATQQASMAGALSQPAVIEWSSTDFMFMLAMWSVMMFAMMLPSATPTIMIFQRICAKREEVGRSFAPTGVFVAGYLVMWIGFSLLATTINYWLHTGSVMSSMMGQVSPMVGGIILVIAGIYQWTPLKDACLAHCRSPMSFLMQHWREGVPGAVIMGLHHGFYCIGCCWLLMLLLFVLGVMNLPWVAVLTLVVLVEKTMPHGRALTRGLGVLLICWGIWLVAGA